MAYGDIPEIPPWSQQYHVNVYQKCPFCQDHGCNICKPEVRDGKSVEELITEAGECVKAYCKLRETPNVWSKLGDLERLLIVYAIDYGRQNSGEEEKPVFVVDRFKELELR